MATDAMLYQRIVNDLRNDIDTGHYRPGDKIPSVSELRAAYQVSHITVMRAYKELCGAGYVYLRRSCGYFVSERNAATELHGRIGNFIRPLWTYNSEDNYFNAINAGVQKEACDLGFDLLSSHSAKCVANQPVPPGGVEEILQSMCRCADDVDGFLVDERIPDDAIAPFLEQLGKPLVIVNRPSALPVGSICPPNYAGMSSLLDFTRHFNYDHYVFCEANGALPNQNERRRAFEDFANRTAISYNIIAGTTVFPWAHTRQQLENTLAEHDARRLLFVTPVNHVGCTVAQFLQQRGMILGKDLGLVSFENLEMASSHNPPLTTVSYPPEDIGAAAVRLLREMLNEPMLRGQKIQRQIDFSIITGKTI